MTKKQHAQQKFHRVLREYSNGELYSHDGKKVTNYKRAIAIAFSEARKYDKNFGASKHENGTKIKTDNTLQLIFEDAFQRYLIDKNSRLTNIENGKHDKLISFDEWLRTTTTGLKYNKRIAQLIRYDETHEPIMNSRGTKLHGRSHARGGIAGINVDTNEPIEVEGGELIITKRIGKIKQHITCHGEAEGIASRLNVISGGDEISDAPATCHLKQEIMKRGKKIKKMENGNKIQSYIEQRKIENIEQKIQRENEMKNNEIESKSNDTIILINDDKSFAIVSYFENRDFSSLKIFKHNNICVYKSDNAIVNFLDKYEIHYTEFDNENEFNEYLKSQLPSRTRNKIQQ